MRITVKQSRRQSNRIELNLASMIDVTFLLLIYFMVSMVIATAEDRLTPTLQTTSEDGSGQTDDFQPQIIECLSLEDRPAFRLGGRVVRDRASLFELLAPLPKDPGIFVQVYDGIPVGFAVTAFQLAHDSGFEKVTYVPAE